MKQKEREIMKQKEGEKKLKQREKKIHRERKRGP
jgi:hypothetical protein